MIASLMMYTRPELEPANERLWSLIRARLAAHGVEAPEMLSQDAPPYEVWQDPALVLSQTCGMPFRTRLKDHVQLVCTPDYALEGCPPGYYRSAIVVRADDPRFTLAEFAPSRLAYNGTDSQSGYAALYAHCAPLGFWFANSVESGGHLPSARMVAEGEADLAALDAQSWRIIERHERFTADLRVLEHTAPTPGLPLITGPAHDPEVIFAALEDALAALLDADRRVLDLRGFVRIPRSAYLEVPTPPRD